jgi:type I restriction-modification system DNA methylase subunit
MGKRKRERERERERERGKSGGDFYTPSHIKEPLQL